MTLRLNAALAYLEIGRRKLPGESSCDIDHMDAVRALAPVCKITGQRFFHGSEGQVVPRNFGFGEQPGLDRFVSGMELVAEQSRAVVEMDLADAFHIHHAEKFFHFKLRAGFLVQEGLYQDARKELLAAIATDATEPSLHQLLGHVYDRMGMKDLATDSFDEARFLSTPRP